MNKIAIIVVYFGKFPNYFPLWLKSCSYNPSIDFLILTDQKQESLPNNVHLIPMTLEEMRNRATKILGFKASLSRPYKCCDYRPMYGVIFADLIIGYDYWGHCDVDLIFGNLQHFFDIYHLYEYDKFGALGHLALYRNTEKVNNAFRLEGGKHNYREIYSSDINFVFDEVSGITKLMIESGFNVFVKRIMADITPLYKRFALSPFCSVDGQYQKNYKDQIFYWENGKIYRDYYSKDEGIKKEEFNYIHFRSRPNFVYLDEVMSADSFYITHQGFVVKTITTNRDIIKKYNNCPSLLMEKIYKWLDYFDYIIIRRIKRNLKK